MSGRIRNCTVTQEKVIAGLMHKTPETPIKTGYQKTPRKSESKRSLFQSNSPPNSDDLGLMHLLSPSSCSSINSLNSPQFSPNGKFSTPPRTPRNDASPVRPPSKISSKKIEVKSSLFPDLKIPISKCLSSSRTPKTLISKMLTPESKDSFDKMEEGINSLSTPSTSRSTRKRGIFGEQAIVVESDSSPSISGLSQEDDENKISDEPTILGIKPLSCESFYGPTPKPLSKIKTKLFIDTLEPKSRNRELTRSLSRDSLSSNKSFVSGGSHKKTHKAAHRHRSRFSNSDRRRAPHVGVWHNIKKPRQIKKIVKNEKPLVSPQSRVAKMLKLSNDKEIQVKSKPLYQVNAKKKIAHGQKRNRNDEENDTIIDSFPNHFVKRKKVPTPRYNVHPAINDARIKNSENLTPDPNKKFLKYGQMRTATFTLNDNVKLQISDGIMRLQTPKKRRKLYSGKKDNIEDFNDFEDGDKEIEENIQGILNSLQKEIEPISKKVDEDNIYDAPIFHLDETQKVAAKPILRVQRSPLKPVSNFPTMILDDFDSDEYEETSADAQEVNQEKKLSEVSLAKTGNMVSFLTNILVNHENDLEASPTKVVEKEKVEEETENSPPNEGKYFSLFYRKNWANSITYNIMNPKSQSQKKKILVPDDQYLLDAGQKSIGIVTCKKCGVMYQAGDFADEATHTNFHNHVSELKFPGWNNERVVGRFPDGRVVMILNGDPKIWWQKVSKIVDIIDQELGFPEASVQSLFYKTVYLYINEKSKQIAGCLIAEECKVAYKMFPPLEGVEIDSCSKDPSPCKIGVSRIWTALSQRRKGVASRMIDCLQRTFFFGDIVPMDLIAFSVPSPQGKLLAQKVTGRLDFLVYGFP